MVMAPLLPDRGNIVKQKIWGEIQISRPVGVGGAQAPLHQSFLSKKVPYVKNG